MLFQCIDKLIILILLYKFLDAIHHAAFEIVCGYFFQSPLVRDHAGIALRFIVLGFIGI